MGNLPTCSWPWAGKKGHARHKAVLRRLVWCFLQGSQVRLVGELPVSRSWVQVRVRSKGSLVRSDDLGPRQRWEEGEELKHPPGTRKWVDYFP